MSRICFKASEVLLALVVELQPLPRFQVALRCDCFFAVRGMRIAEFLSRFYVEASDKSSIDLSKASISKAL